MAHFINTETLEYPLTEQQVKQRFPNVSFGQPFEAPEPYAIVTTNDLPLYNPITHEVIEVEPELVDDEWRQRFEVRELGASIVDSNLQQFTSEAKNRAIQRINRHYEMLTRQLSTGYPTDEQKSWPIQVSEADIIISGSVEPTPWIDSAAVARGITREALANLIRAQDTLYRQYHGTLTGIRQRLRDEIDAILPSAEAPAILDAIQWPTTEI